MEFNESQKIAIEHGDGPMLLLAGPGSGKTTVLIHRIKYMIQHHGIRPEHILVITFTKAAANEMKIRKVVIPAAKSGVITGIVLGIGRAIGETMAVIMIAGNQPRLVNNILLGVRTLTGNIVIEMGYATGLYREALIATGVVLFVFILIINLCVSALKRRAEDE